MSPFDQNDTSVSTASTEEEEANNWRKRRFDLSDSTRKYLRFTVIGLIVLIVGAMLIGVLSHNSQDSAFPPANKTCCGNINSSSGNAADYTYAAATTTEAATTTAAAATTAAATTVAAGTSYGDVSSSSGSNQTNTSTGSLPSDRMIVRNGSIAITANNVTDTLNQVTAFINGEGGLVFSTNVNHSGDNANATLVVQVPPEKFDDTMAQVGKLGVKIISQGSSSQDVTGEYVDNDAAIKNLTTTENQLTTLMSKATTVGDVLAVQDKLTTVRGQIDTLEGRQKVLAKESSMSSLNITIAPVPVETPPPPPAPVVDNSWNLNKTVKTAWEGSVEGLEGLATVGITIALYFWIWLPLLIIGWLVRRMYRGSQLRQNNL